MTHASNRVLGSTRRRIALWLLLFTFGSLDSRAGEAPVSAPLSAEQVVKRLVEMNQQRDAALRSYRGTRVYHLVFRGFPSDKAAEVTVAMSYQHPDQKEFTILSENGSKTLRTKVLKRLLESEQQALQKETRQRAAIHPDNYTFRLLSYEQTPGRNFYVLEAIPKTKDKFLFRGKIWVDGEDFAVVRIEGEPAKNPSWWTTHNQFQRSYRKVGDFWLPERNESVSKVRLFGQAWLTIEYGDYELTGTASLAEPSSPPAPYTRVPMATSFTGRQ